MSVHVAVAAPRLNWNHFRKLDKSPIDGKVAQTATDIQPTRVRTKTTDEGAQITQLVVELRLDADQCWVV